MKQGCLTLIVWSMFAVSGLAQENDSQKLTQQALVLFQQGKFDEAINVAERAKSLELKVARNNWQNIATATLNLCMLKKEHYRSLLSRRSDKGLSDEDRESIAKTIRNYNLSLPNELRQLIRFIEVNTSTETLQLATAKLELAIIEDRFQTDVSIYYSEKVKEIEQLFNDGLRIRENLLGADNELTISTVLEVANFYNRKCEYEKSVLLFERYVQMVEKKYGSKSYFLVPALRSIARFLNAINEEDRAREIVTKIEAITGEKELPTPPIDLSLRNKIDEVSKLIQNAPISTKLRSQKFLLANVTIDESGKVVDVLVGDTREKNIFGKDVKTSAETSIRKWTFRPLIYQGRARSVRGNVWFPYLVYAVKH